jgi:hypothetical protein
MMTTSFCHGLRAGEELTAHRTLTRPSNIVEFLRPEGPSHPTEFHRRFVPNLFKRKQLTDVTPSSLSNYNKAVTLGLNSHWIEKGIGINQSISFASEDDC